MTRLQGKNVLITGASTGIGKAIAVRFAEEGASVAINYRSGPEEAEATRVQVHEACPGGTQLRLPRSHRAADISKEDHVREMFRRVIGEFGQIDVLVNNAGIQKPAPSHEIDADDFDRVLNVNLRGAFPLFPRGHTPLSLA